ncbi:MAG: hypothetical protein LBR70_02450 [Lactobacillaceae bacterium]|nr:hypothetical protein [Lactobacillaceae bacterium]
MKKNIIITVIAIAVFSLVSASAFAQHPTKPRPKMDSELQEAIRTLGVFTQESVEVKSDGKGSLDFWRLTGIGFNLSGSWVKDGMDLKAGMFYQLRIPKAPWTRGFILGANFGGTQISIDGNKKFAFSGDATLMLDLVTWIAPKSHFVFNVGGGASFHHVSYSAQIPTGENKGFNHTYGGSAWGPIAKAQIGYDFGRRVSLMAEVSYTAFNLERKPLETINYSSFRAGVTLAVKIGRK